MFKRKENKMTDLNYAEMPTCNPEDGKPETVKSILMDMDDILKGIFKELRMIDDAIYSKKDDVENAKDSNEPMQKSLLETLKYQRKFAESLSYLAIHIREGLW
jgi:hypothetical protein